MAQVETETVYYDTVLEKLLRRWHSRPHFAPMESSFFSACCGRGFRRRRRLAPGLGAAGERATGRRPTGRRTGRAAAAGPFLVDVAADATPVQDGARRGDRGDRRLRAAPETAANVERRGRGQRARNHAAGADRRRGAGGRGPPGYRARAAGWPIVGSPRRLPA